ncbi:hypothetical protein BT69DRAFT_1284814 [Atractiella rhizophila]|nr:hypothetical protein BT69DRAFT_1284814 [Atractiella rhizophila]
MCNPNKTGEEEEEDAALVSPELVYVVVPRSSYAIVSSKPSHSPRLQRQTVHQNWLPPSS